VKLNIYFFLLGFIGLCKLSLSQDIHWSQFNDNQLFQNPAHAGHFNGDYRFISNYRNQWKSVTVPFSTFSASIDMRKKNLGIGVLFFHDQAGDGKFKTIEAQVNLSYQLNLVKDSSHVLRFGLNGGLNHRQLNWDKLYFDNQFNGYVFDPTLPTNENYQADSKSNLSIGLGIMHEWKRTNRFKITSGFGAYNLNQPNQGFYTSIVKRDIRLTTFVKGTFQLNPKWDVVPSIQYAQQGIYRELIVGSSLKYYLLDTPKKHQALYIGGWNRGVDASFLSLGMDYNDLFVGISYDINYSKLVPASRLRGGFELAARYIIRTFKPKKILHRVCPDFI
jgi:type IX secretion system PorP/SprF family membrane protein